MDKNIGNKTLLETLHQNHALVLIVLFESDNWY